MKYTERVYDWIEIICIFEGGWMIGSGEWKRMTLGMIMAVYGVLKGKREKS